MSTAARMFGEVMSLRRPSASAPADNNTHPSFPIYLLPSLHIPFRRRRIYEPPPSPPSSSSEPSSPGSTTPSLSASPTSPSTPPRRLSRAQPPTLRCSSCSTDLAFLSQIVSKGFTGRHGRAYLVAPPPHPHPSAPTPPSPPGGAKRQSDSTDAGANRDLANIRVGRPETRRLVTGAHVVADIYCCGCSAVIGWKYLDTAEPAQRYKVGMFILETRRVVGFCCWEDVDVGDLDMDNSMGIAHHRHGEGGGNGRDEGHDEGDGVVVFDSEDEEECEDMFAGVWDATVVARRRRSR
ncbi:yippee-domain-containing protein, partial [Parathielavia appendiculata]